MLALKHQWKTLSLSFTDAILTISMNRPKANAMSPELLNELTDAFNQASNDNKMRGVLLRSNLNSTFCAGADLSTVYNLSVAGQQSAIDKFIFHTLSRGMTAPLYCSKPVACSLDGHTIAGGLMLALSCDYIAIGTRKPFRIGITGPIVGIPYPLKAVKLVQHQLEPQLGYRLLVDANLFSSIDFPIRCERSETPDDLSRKWLTMMSERPLQGFQITKKKWWSDLIKLDNIDNEQEKKEYFNAVTSNECLQAMKKALTKEK
ncbi:unnamed protein product [Adineta steineri]|uniref:Uncharacterized protein n=1 Tax=Adineta steineri TaxID=433720 RepID=A0A815VW16_9BILA|nr:unnamed protein product [Adineta steineri]CAF1535434.1 unnamed protein product [Adineta steineri]